MTVATKRVNKNEYVPVLYTMKYTARHIRRFIEEGRIDSDLWKTHFPTLLPSQVPECTECEDYKDKTCAGGRDPVECFLALQPEVAKADGQAKKKTKGLMLKGPRKIAVPSGANTTRDQSKM